MADLTSQKQQAIGDNQVATLDELINDLCTRVRIETEDKLKGNDQPKEFVHSAVLAIKQRVKTLDLIARLDELLRLGEEVKMSKPRSRYVRNLLLKRGYIQKRQSEIMCEHTNQFTLDSLPPIISCADCGIKMENV